MTLKQGAGASVLHELIMHT